MHTFYIWLDRDRDDPHLVKEKAETIGDIWAVYGEGSCLLDICDEADPLPINIQEYFGFCNGDMPICEIEKQLGR